MPGAILGYSGEADMSETDAASFHPPFVKQPSSFEGNPLTL